MDETWAGIESELLDLSTVTVATLRSVELTGITAATARVRARVADSAESVSGFNPSFTGPPGLAGPEAEDHHG